MTTTTRQLIEGVLIENGAKDPDVPLTGQEIDMALRKFNALMAVWALDFKLSWKLQKYTLALTGAASYTIGKNQDVDTIAPNKIYRATYTENDKAIEVEILNDDKYININICNINGVIGNFCDRERPDIWMYYKQDYPAGTIEVPISSMASGTLDLYIYESVGQVTIEDIDDTINIPNEFILPIELELGIILARSFKYSATPEMVELATVQKRKLVNSHIKILTNKANDPFCSRRFIWNRWGRYYEV